MILDWWNSLNKGGRALTILLIVLGVLGLNSLLYTLVQPQPTTNYTDDVVVNDLAMSPASPSATPVSSESSVQNAPRTARTPQLPLTAVVDGVTYSGQEQIDAMTQAARDAGMDEATARRTGREAAILCNGNPDCLR
jgi:uncharacterized protein (DUF2252 family)